MLSSTLKPRACKHCKSPFVPARRLQNVCGPMCGLERARIKREAEQKKAERQSDRVRREALKRLPDYIKEAQTAFNAFVRLRDEKKPCICCGRFADDRDLLTGSRWDCGHYRSTGSASHLRFNEDNAHRQLVVCNRHGAGRAVDYRLGLIARIGLARVEALENDRAPRKFTREELIEIRDTYRAKVRLMKRNGNHPADLG